jgi:hypothetical protein
LPDTIEQGYPMDQALEAVRTKLFADAENLHKRNDNPRWWDNVLYNWGTGLAILLNALAVAAPADSPDAVWVLAKIAGCIATAWIAVDRILLFGTRWQFALSQQAECRAVQSHLNCVELLIDEAAQRKELERIRDWLIEIWRNDKAFPGIQAGARN